MRKKENQQLSSMRRKANQQLSSMRKKAISNFLNTNLTDERINSFQNKNWR
jgi:hypothetical protein